MIISDCILQGTGARRVHEACSSHLSHPGTGRGEVKLGYLWYHDIPLGPRRVDIPCSRVVLGPNPDELIQVMRSQDGGVSG